MSIQPWKTISSNSILETPFVSVHSDAVELPNGNVIPDFYTITIQDAALIVAITEDNHIILAREYRYACKEVVTECPAGMVENGEDPLTTAKRELLEETGYSSDDWIYLGSSYESTSKLTNIMHQFLAKDCRKVAEQRLEEYEGNIDLMIMPLIEAVELVMDGSIKPNSSANAILKAARLLGV